MRINRHENRRALCWRTSAGLGVTAAGLVILSALAAQIIVWPDAAPGLLLLTAEGAAGIGLATAGFAMMVAAADPFADDDG